jgi:hypothetical protein
VSISPTETALPPESKVATEKDDQFESDALRAISEICQSHWSNFYWVTFGRASSPWHYLAGGALPNPSAQTLRRFCDMTQQDRKSLIWSARKRWRETRGRVAHFVFRHIRNEALSESVAKNAHYPKEELETAVPDGYEDWVFPDAITALFFVGDPNDPSHDDPIAAAVLCFRAEAAKVIDGLPELRSKLSTIAARYRGLTRWTVDPEPVEAWLDATALATGLFNSVHDANKWTESDIAAKHDELLAVERAGTVVLAAVEAQLHIASGRELGARCLNMTGDQCEHLWVAKALQHCQLHPRMISAALGWDDAVPLALRRIVPVLSDVPSDLIDVLAGFYLVGAERLSCPSITYETSPSLLVVSGQLTPRGDGEADRVVNALRIATAMFHGDASPYQDDQDRQHGGRGTFTAACACLRRSATSIAVDVRPRGKSVDLKWRFQAECLP